MTETPIGFGIIGSGNMARVYADALATQVTGGRLTAVALGIPCRIPCHRVRGRHRSVGREPRRPTRCRRGRHRHAAFDPPAAGARGRRGRQACLPREADGPRRRRVRPDHRRLQPCRGPTDDRQADPPHGDVDAGQDLRRRGADRRDPVPPADERDARSGLRQRPAELAVRSARGGRLPRLGRPRLRRRALVHRRRAGPHLRGLRQLHRPAPREPDGDGPDPASRAGRSPRSCCATRSDRPGSGPGATTSTRSSARRGRSSGTSTGSSCTPGRATSSCWELPSWTLPDFKPRDPRRIGNTARQIDDFIGTLRAGTPPTISGADGRAAIEMTQAAKLSAQTGRAVDLPLPVAPTP